MHADAALGFLVVDAADPDALLAYARADPAVRYAELDGEVHALFAPDDPLHANGEQYGPGRIGAGPAWDRTLGTAASSVCIVDSGVRLTHEDLAGARYAGGIDLVDGDAEPDDPHGHGTFVTAIAVATTHNAKGMAGVSQSTYRHARVLDATGGGAPSDAASAMGWCADQGAHVVSLSLGTSSNVASMRDAATYAWSRGAALVAASGNAGCVGPGCVLYPAAYPEFIATGCTNAVDARCTLSNGGPELAIVAPGDLIVSASNAGDTAYRYASGTSAAAPHVAGALALLKSWAPGMTNAAMRARLESSALDLGDPGWDTTFGHGLVQIDAMLPNAGPRLALACGPSPAAVWRTLTCNITGTDDEGHGFYAEVAWGDGATERVPASGFAPSGTTLAATHRYAENGTYAIQVVATDNASEPGGGAPAAATITIVPNLPPVASVPVCSPNPGVVGTPIVCTLRATDDSDGVAFHVDWGDGVQERVPASGHVVPGTSFTASHVFPSAGTYSASFRPVDDSLAPLPGEARIVALEVSGCSEDRTGKLLAGAAGARLEGTSSTRVAIAPSCQRLPFELRGIGLAANVDVCWFAGSTSIGCQSSLGDERGIVPIGATVAEIVLFTGLDVNWSLRIPAFEVGPPPDVVVLRADDDELDRALVLNFRDDVAEKRLRPTLDHRLALPTRATLHVLGLAYACTSNQAVALLQVNGAPVTTFSPCASFSRAGYAWTDFSVPIELLLPDAENTFAISKLATASFTSNNLLLGIDADTNAGRSTIHQDGAAIPGELMWYVTLE